MFSCQRSSFVSILPAAQHLFKKLSSHMQYVMHTFDGIRILFIVNTLKRRGAEQQLLNFVEELPHNIEVRIFTFSNAEEDFCKLIMPNRAKIYSNKHLGKFNPLRFKLLYDCLSKAKCDVVITVGLGAALFYGRMCAVLYGTKIFYSVLNTFENFHKLPKLPGDYFDIFNKGANTLIPRLPGKRLYRFLPNSNQLARKIRPYLEMYPVQTLHNGLIQAEFKRVLTYTPAKKTRLLHSYFEGYSTIAQVGALDGIKNQLFTLECIRDIKQNVPNVRFLIIGEGYKKPELVRRALANGIDGQVIFAGQLNRMDCLYLMSKSNLLVLTSDSESFPNVLLEGQALSLPVVTFDVGAASEIIEHGVTGYVIHKGDRKGFKKNISKLLRDKELATRMGKKGKERVLDLFSMDKKVEDFLSLLEKDALTIRGTN